MLIVWCICFHFRTSIPSFFFNEGQQAVILVCFLCFQGIHSQHTFPAVRTHLIHHKSEEPPSISALKFEIRLGVKDMCSVYTTWTICALEQTPCCAAWRGVERWGREKGGNCHIKGKEFKINLISQSLSPPKRLTVSMLHLVLRHKQRTETAEWKRWGTHWGSRPPVNQNDPVGWLTQRGATLYEKTSYVRLGCTCEVAPHLNLLLPVGAFWPVLQLDSVIKGPGVCFHPQPNTVNPLIALEHQEN